jgi:hypothetical protein
VSAAPTTADVDRGLEPALAARIGELQQAGQKMWTEFDRNVRREEWHPFVPADYARVLAALLPLRAPGRRFLEFGSATGVITIMADLIGFDAYGIELDAALVATARSLAAEFGSGARFAAGSFLPAGYEWRSATGDPRRGTIGDGTPAYGDIGLSLSDFDLVFAYPWTGEADLMRDVVRRCGGAGTRLLMYGPSGAELFEGDAR